MPPAINDYKQTKLTAFILSLSLLQVQRMGRELRHPGSRSGRVVYRAGTERQLDRQKHSGGRKPSLHPAYSLFARFAFPKLFSLLKHGLLPPECLDITSPEPIITLDLPFQLFHTWRWGAEQDSMRRFFPQRMNEYCVKWSASMIIKFVASPLWRDLAGI